MSHSDPVPPSENENMTQASRLRSAVLWSFKTLIKLTFILSLTLLVYGIYLDGKIRQKFEGQRWKIPVQVYGEIIHFEKAQKIDITVLKQTLITAHYKSVLTVKEAGEFSLNKNQLTLYRKSFDDSGFDVEEKILRVSFSKGIITDILLDGRSVLQVKLNPFLLDRIVPDNKEDRVLVALGEVPERLLDALLLVEDREFYFHSGISPLGILRAIITNIQAGRNVQGGSTLTQQLVKNMFLTRHKTLWRKANEAIMALLLEYRYSKDELLEAYINEVYLGQHYANGIYGFGLASDFYFGKALEDISPAQMALLISVVKGPSFYDPWRYPKRALARRDIILKLMFSENLLSKTEYIQAINADLSIRKNRRIVQQKNPAYLQLVKAELTEHLSQHELESGVKVFTGFSLYMQKMLEQTVERQLPLLEKKYKAEDLQTAMLVSDIHSGEVKALVGDRRQGYAGFNRAIHAYRAIGSLIKPAIYLAALERYEEYTLATVLEDKPITLKSNNGKAWSPKNYDGKYKGHVNLLHALSFSLNIPTVNLGMQLGLDRVVEAIKLLNYTKNIVPRPSILLGAVSMSPFEVNQLYLTIASQGYYKKSHVIKQVVSEQGALIWSFNEPTQQVFSAQGAYLLDYALTEVTQAGTARSLTWRLGHKTLAGKTGTTNDQRDSWFVGYDNQHLVTTWIGRDDNATTPLTGSSGALILFADFMKKLGVEGKAFDKPYGVDDVAFNQITGKPFVEACENQITLPAVLAGIHDAQACDDNTPIEKATQKAVSWLEKLFGLD